MSDDSEKIAGMAIMSMARDIDEKDAEIKRLRGLLREALEDGYIRVPYGASHEDVSAILDFEKRIREAI